MCRKTPDFPGFYGAYILADNGYTRDIARQIITERRNPDERENGYYS